MNARDVLELRQRVRGGLRVVFDGLGFLEVDTPVLATEVLPEAHIDPVAVAVDGGARATHYLQASPELLMKRLLAAGSGPIWQFARSFRAGEVGRQHDVEFVLLEWYAPGATLDDTAKLLDRLLEATLGTGGIERATCADAFLAHAGVDPLAAPLAELEAAAARAGVTMPEWVAALPEPARWDRAFELVLAEVVQPRLGHGRPTMLEDWPASQAAFARLDPDRPRVARRFELFATGVELANGWEEETGRAALAARIDAANRARLADGRAALPVPARLLEAHGPTMPAGVGAALGFERLVMLAAGADSIDAVRCFTSRTA
ncbi:MAG: amino acid--tRNA ligase-related protein [Planctomycetaceae bacterium]